jgi:tRNA U34 5-methylaminomethyl-2-thiouridine-forming methyltransferase MnmC
MVRISNLLICSESKLGIRSQESGKMQGQIIKRTLITTEDGSHSLYVPELNEHYHSTHGAVQESNHVFIAAGLSEILKSKSSISIFEMGFGTGLNAFLTLIYALDHAIDIQYTTIEAFPVEEELLNELNFGKIIKEGVFENYFMNLYSAEWGQWKSLHENFQIKKSQASLLDFKADDKFDLIYFDAFAPNVQPELWTTEVFVKIFQSMNSNGILVTYCCKGDVKRSLKSAGFVIEKLPGPPGKGEMLRAMKY